MRLDGRGALTVNDRWCMGFLDSRLRGNDGLPAREWRTACAGMMDCLRGNDGLLGGE